MTRTITALFLSTCLLAGSGCLLTDRLDIEPADATKGDEVKQMLTESGEFVALLAQYLFLSNGLSVNPATGSFARDAVAAGLIAPTIATVDDDTYYTNSSVAECRSKIQFEGLILVGAAVQSFRTNCQEPPDPNCLTTFQNSYSAGGLFGGRQIAELCDLRETGTILHFGDTGQL